MTIIDVIGRIDTLKPNGYKQSEKIKWLSELDSEIKKQIDHKHRISRFKFQTIPVYHNGLPMVIEDETDFYK